MKTEQIKYTIKVEKQPFESEELDEDQGLCDQLALYTFSQTKDGGFHVHSLEVDNELEPMKDNMKLRLAYMVLKGINKHSGDHDLKNNLKNVLKELEKLTLR